MSNSTTSSYPNRSSRPHIVVVGGGVVGISLALSLLDVPEEHRFNVTIVAADLPVTRKQIDHPNVSVSQKETPVVVPASYASSWAGAHHVSSPSNEREAKWELQAFNIFKGILKLTGEKSWQSPTSSASSSGQVEKDASSPLCWVRQVEVFPTVSPRTDTEAKMRAALKIYPHYSETGGLNPPSSTSFFQSSSSLPAEKVYHFHTLDINVPVYLPLLYGRFLFLGGRAIQRQVTSLAEAKQIATSNSPAHWLSPQLIFVTPGLGAAHLSEIKDDKVFPVRGQTLLVRAPWMKFEGADGSEERPLWPALSRLNDNGERDLYIIPRGGGDFIVGGTREVGKTDPHPSQETTRAILQRALQVCPSLLPPQKRHPPGITPRWEDVDVVGLNVGLRPSRKGGPILEEWKGREIEGAKVILGYGFGGYGYQQSWGAALEGRQLINAALGVSPLSKGYTLLSLEEAGVLRDAAEKVGIPGLREKDRSGAKL